MATIAITYGLLLGLLSAGFYAATEALTSLIPAYFGVGLLSMGLLARNPKLRMHAMHAAALIGLVGCLMPAYMAIKTIASGTIERPLAVWLQGIMAVVCAAFVAQCVKSFIDARKARKAEEAAAS